MLLCRFNLFGISTERFDRKFNVSKKSRKRAIDGFGQSCVKSNNSLNTESSADIQNDPPMLSSMAFNASPPFLQLVRPATNVNRHTSTNDKNVIENVPLTRKKTNRVPVTRVPTSPTSAIIKPVRFSLRSLAFAYRSCISRALGILRTWIRGYETIALCKKLNDRR